MEHSIESITGEKYPFRDKIQLNERFVLIYWHNNDHSEKLWQLVQRTYEEFDKTKDTFFVRAQFKYINEMIKYISTFDFDDI